MLREWSLDHLVAGKQAPDALGVHDERTYPIGRLRRRRIVRHIDADPSCAVPFDERLVRIPWTSGKIGTGAIVENPPVRRPRPGPVRRNALLARVRRVTACHLVALLGIASREDPAAGCCCAVVAQLGEAIQQLAGTQGDPAGFILEVHQCPTVHVLRQFLRIGVGRVGVVPGQVQDRVGECAAILAIHLAHPMENSRHDPDVALRFARWIGRLPMPLQPARRIDQRTVFLGEAGCRQLEDLGLDRSRIGRVLRAEILPEPRGLGVQRIHHDEEFQLAQAGADLALVRERLQRIEPLADVAIHLTVASSSRTRE